MIERLLENRWTVSAVLSDPVITKPSAAKEIELTNEEWHSINSICPVLDPIKLTTVMLSAEENVSISIALPAVAGLLQNTVINEDDPDTVRAFKEEFHDQLITRFKMDVRNRDCVTVLHKAAFLDPRFAHMCFVTGATRVLVIDVLRQELASLPPTTAVAPDLLQLQSSSAHCK